MNDDPILSDPDIHLPFELTDELRQVILELAQQPDIHSISCPFNDFSLWEGLLKEQVKRSIATGRPPQEALCLCGPDSGITGMSKDYSWDEDGCPAIPDPVTGKFAPDFFGGEVHIPYEGVSGGDLFIYPEWRNLYPEASIRLQKLSAVTHNKPCNYLLTNRNLGEFEFATRRLVAGCFLYKSKDPYMNCNPFNRPSSGQ